jgi:acetyltransferase-like isoleucine patch superfamily enzyme
MLDRFRQGLSLLRQVFERGEVALTSTAVRFVARAKGVEVGRKTIFIKSTQFSRAAGSTLHIQDHCRFRSDSKSNRVGVNRACYLSTLRRGAILRIGPHCAFSGTVIAAAKHIELGSYVRCGANTTILDTDFHEDDPRSGEPRSVQIEDHVWLGLNVIVQKGVRIGRNSVIAAGSVVTRDIPPNVVAGGIPANVIKAFSAEIIDRTEAFYREKSRR